MHAGALLLRACVNALGLGKLPQEDGQDFGEVLAPALSTANVAGLSLEQHILQLLSARVSARQKEADVSDAS